MLPEQRACGREQLLTTRSIRCGVVTDGAYSSTVEFRRLGPPARQPGGQPAILDEEKGAIGLVLPSLRLRDQRYDGGDGQMGISVGRGEFEDLRGAHESERDDGIDRPCRQRRDEGRSRLQDPT